MKYRAFISYSHAADDKLAPAVQAGLHRFAKPWYKLSAIHTFRDQTNLSVNPNLWGQIEAALNESDYFVLLASPQSASSKWVRQEVAHWLTNRSADQLLIVVTDGELVWDDATGDFDWEKTTALPPVLRKRCGREPHYLKLQWAKSTEDLSLHNSRFRDAIADLAATLHGKTKHELIGDDVREHRRTRRVASAAVSIVLVLAVIAGVGWYRSIQQQRVAEANARRADASAGEARRQQKIAEKNELRAQEQTKEADRQRTSAEARRIEAERERNLALARQLAAQSELVLGRQHDLALSRALAADQTASTAESRRALFRAISWNPRAKRLLQANGATGLAFSRDGRRLAVSRDYGIDVWDVESWRKTPLCHDVVRDRLHSVAISPDGTLVAAAGGRQILVWEISGKSNPEECGASSDVPYGQKTAQSLAFSPDGRFLAIGFARAAVPGFRSHIEVRPLNRITGRIVIGRTAASMLTVPGDGVLEPSSLAFGRSAGSLRAVFSTANRGRAEQQGIYEWKEVSSPGAPDMIRRVTTAVVLNADGSAIIPEGVMPSGGAAAAGAFQFQNLNGTGFDFQTESALRSLAATSSGDLLAGIDGCGLIVVLAKNDASLIRLENDVTRSGIGSPDTFVSISPDGGRVDVWDLQAGRMGTLAADPGWSISAAQLRLRRRQIVLVQRGRGAQEAQRLQVRSLNGGDVYWELVAAEHDLLPFAVSLDGRLLAHGASSVSIWDIDQKQRIATLKPDRAAGELAFALDGRRLLIGSSEILGAGSVDADPFASLSIAIWGNLTSKKPKMLDEISVTQSDDLGESFSVLRYSPNGKTLAVATSNRLVLLEPAAGELSAGVSDFAFSAHGDLIAGLGAGKITLWDVQTLDRLGEVPTGSLPVTGLWFTVDDRRLVYKNADGISVFEGPSQWRERAQNLLGEMKPRATCAPGT